MTRQEAVAVNRLLLAVLAQRSTLAMLGIGGVGATAFGAETLEAAKSLASRARAQLGKGIDSVQVHRAWNGEMETVLGEIRKEIHDSELERVR